MSHTNILLDKYRKACLLQTDMAVAEKLGISRGTVSSWRHEVRHAEPESVAAMAKACGLDAEEWVLRVQADREVIAARKQVWLRAAQRLAATAAICALSLITHAEPIQIAANTTRIHAPAELSRVYIMRSYGCFREACSTRPNYVWYVYPGCFQEFRPVAPVVPA